MDHTHQPLPPFSPYFYKRVAITKLSNSRFLILRPYVTANINKLMGCRHHDIISLLSFINATIMTLMTTACIYTVTEISFRYDREYLYDVVKY